jgi:NAD(P)-dependent dehydrogenase (short-subunit alcohol dehydrogenase family)
MEVTQEGFDRQFETNLKAPFFLSQCFIKYLMDASIKPANLLFISSEMGLYCSDVPYGLGKASLNSLVEGLARRYVNDGIRVNAIAPGVLSNEASDVTKDDLYRKYSCGQRFIMPEEVAEVASFILSDASNCITGAVIPCNQGNHLRCDW